MRLACRRTSTTRSARGAARPSATGPGFIAPRTVHHIWMTLVVALRKGAHKQRISLAENPCAFVDAPRFERTEMKALPANDGRLWGTLAAFAVDPDNGRSGHHRYRQRRGVRRTLALRWCDVDLEAGTLRVARALERASVLHDDPADASLAATGIEIRFRQPKTNTFCAARYRCPPSPSPGFGRIGWRKRSPVVSKSSAYGARLAKRWCSTARVRRGVRIPSACGSPKRVKRYGSATGSSSTTCGTPRQPSCSKAAWT